MNRFHAFVAMSLILVPVMAPAEPAYREYSEHWVYQPHVSGDEALSGSYRYWKNPGLLDMHMAGDPENNWKLNWKFLDSISNTAIHGGHFALDRGEKLYKEINHDGRFARCLGAEQGKLEGLRTGYPRYRLDLKRVAGLEEVIEHCAKAQEITLENCSHDNSSISLFVASKSNDKPLDMKLDNTPMREAFERGQALFHLKTGKWNLSCASCHTYNTGRYLRGTVITTPYGDAAHYPVFLAVKGELRSLQLRFTQCALSVGVQPLKPGSSAYTDLEVFLTALSNGYPVSVPTERY